MSKAARDPADLQCQIDAVKRELGYRRTVFPRRVGARQMSQAESDYQIAVFERLQARLELLLQSEPAKPKDGELPL